MPKYLVRLVLLFVLGATTVVLARGMLVPSSFWQLGHYRAKALGEVASQEPRYMGRKACRECHDELVDMKDFRHARVACETCHGPARQHATSDEPEAHKPPKKLKNAFCLRCHQKDVSRPTAQPQVDPKTHEDPEEDCRKCHTIHQPSTPKTPSPQARPSHQATPAPSPQNEASPAPAPSPRTEASPAPSPRSAPSRSPAASPSPST